MKKSNLQKGFVRLLPAAGRGEVPWKNGRGVSAQVAIDPPDSNLQAGNFLWRASIADVTDPGDFSIFPGCDRWITVLDSDKTLSLSSKEGSRKILKIGEAFQFSGDEATRAEIPQGKLRDLSFVYQREAISAKMKIIDFKTKPRSFSIERGSVIMFAIEGRFSLSAYPGEHQFILAPLDAVIVLEEKAARERLLLIEPQEESGRLATIEITS